jgi:hypothetical protein
VILDGMDEIAKELRPAALQALSEQANFRVVVLSRTVEMASAAASPRGALQGAVAIELRAIAPAIAADYLECVQLDPPPDGWRDLIDRIRTSQGSPLTNAVNSPLTLTLIRDTYQSGDDARELLNFSNTAQQHVSGEQATEDITGHLLDRVLPAAYARRPGQPPPRYDYETAKNAFKKIADRMTQDGARDLQWWRIPEWAPSAPRIIVAGLVTGLVTGLWAGLVIGLVFGLVFGLVAGLASGFWAGLAARKSSDPPKRIGRLQLRRAFNRKSLRVGLVAGLVAGLVFGLVAGLWAGLAEGVSLALADPDSTSSPSPSVSWHDDRKYAVVAGLWAGLGSGLWAGLWAGLGFGLPMVGLWAGLVAGLVFGLVTGLVFGLETGLVASHVWPSSLAAIQLAMQWRTPAHLIEFLDDARERNVLRTVGPVYQFRHASLQDRLAATHAESSNNSNMTYLQARKRRPTPTDHGQ